MNESILKFPNVFFYSFFKPKIFLENVVKHRWKVPTNLIFIEILSLTLLPITVNIINKILTIFRGGNIILILACLLLTAVFKFSVLFTHNYLMQRSFLKDKLKKATSPKESEDDYWHRDIGFFNIIFIYFIHTTIPLLLFSLICSLKDFIGLGTISTLLSIVLIITALYELYVNILTLSILFNKKGLLQTFFWQWGKAIIAFILTICSLFGILMIPIIIFRINSLKNFYSNNKFPKYDLLGKLFIAIPFIFIIVIFSLIYYLVINIRDFSEGFSDGIKATKNEKSRLEELKNDNPKLNPDELSYIDKINQKYKFIWKKTSQNDPNYEKSLKILPESMIKVNLFWELDHNGNLIKDSERIINGSGYKTIDDICLLTIKNASPFPIPPESIKKSTPDGKVHINFEFKYNFYRRKQ